MWCSGEGRQENSGALRVRSRTPTQGPGVCLVPGPLERGTLSLPTDNCLTTPSARDRQEVGARIRVEGGTRLSLGGSVPSHLRATWADDAPPRRPSRQYAPSIPSRP